MEVENSSVLHSLVSNHCYARVRGKLCSLDHDRVLSPNWGLKLSVAFNAIRSISQVSQPEVCAFIVVVMPFDGLWHLFYRLCTIY